MSSTVLCVLISLVAFIVGQLYGERKMKKRAALHFSMLQKGFDGYRQALGEVLTLKGMNMEALDKEALQHSMRKTFDKLTEMGMDMMNKRDDDNDNADKPDKPTLN